MNRSSKGIAGRRLTHLSLLVFSLLLVVVAIGQQPGEDQPKRLGSDSPVLYKEAAEWPVQALSAAGFPAGPWNFIQVASVAMNSNGNVLLLHRGAHPIMEFDAGGKFLRSWGDGLISEGKVAYIPEEHRGGGTRYTAVYGPAGCTSCGAHSIRVDHQGNIWVVDATAHVVYKMNQQGKILMTLGAKGKAGTGPKNFNLPTDVAVASNGNIWVSDGYAGARVVKFSPDGKFLLEFGKRGTGPGEFGMPHNVQVDAQERVYISDRDNGRVQVFDSNGKFLKVWAGTGGASALHMTKDQRLWVGGVLFDLEGKPVGRLPGNNAGHGGMAIAANGDVYVAYLNGTAKRFEPASIKQ
jgi:DNA-binding beta-propeller fold protein YncE